MMRSSALLLLLASALRLLAVEAQYDYNWRPGRATFYGTDGGAELLLAG